MTGLYFHIPFCQRKCLYCDFFSVPANDDNLETYVQLLLHDLQQAAARDWSGPASTIYFGGGTPSLLSPGQISTILQEVDRLFVITREAEISLEANPGTVSKQSLSGYRYAGINRLSLGLQTCNDGQLAKLGRLHDRKQGTEAVSLARQAGFDNLSLDLMFALPNQTLAELEEDLQCYLDLAPEHLSCYGLTAEPQTPLHSKVTAGEISLPNEDYYADAFMLIHERLSAAGYQHYEIANYARQGFACQHNLGYWQRKPYLGIGAGAHSFQNQAWGHRSQNPNDLHKYQQLLTQGKDPGFLLETFDRDSALKETIYLALRTKAGIQDSELQHQFDCNMTERFPEAVKNCSQWLSNNSGRWSLSPEGWLLFDHLIQHFL